MINITIENNLDLFQDYEKCLLYLRQLDFSKFEYPKETTNFHVYSEIRDEKELLCIQSYFATQNLEKTNLILWSDYDISDNKLIHPYKGMMELRVYDAATEAKNTILEGNSKWINANDNKHYMKSGLLRFIATHKYGGIWVDMDMVLLRDFKPILDQEWAYMWGSEMDFAGFGPCAAMMGIKKNSEHSNLCLKKILETTEMPRGTVLDHKLLAKVYRERKFTIFPSVFFNTEWQINVSYVNGIRVYDPEGLGTKIGKGWFSKNDFSNYLFDGALSWHWHNAEHKSHFPEEGSKFDLISKKINKTLLKKGLV